MTTTIYSGYSFWIGIYGLFIELFFWSGIFRLIGDIKKLWNKEMEFLHRKKHVEKSWTVKTREKCTVKKMKNCYDDKMENQSRNIEIINLWCFTKRHTRERGIPKFKKKHSDKIATYKSNQIDDYEWFIQNKLRWIKNWIDSGLDQFDKHIICSIRKKNI